MKSKYLYLAILTFISLFLHSCKPNENSKGSVWKSNDKVKVVSTTTMLTDLAQIIGGEKVEVRGLMDHKIDPHGYEQTFEDTKAINSADIIIYNGLHLEAKMQKGLEVKAERTGGVYAVGKSIPAEKLLNDAGERDPHIWGDPQLWMLTIDPVLEGFIAADPDNKDYYTANADKYKTELIELHDWAKSRVAEIPEKSRVLVTSHDAFQYFATAYGFEVKGLQGLSSAEEVGGNSANKLVEYIKSKGIKTIFSESVTNNKGIQVVAKEAQVKVSETPLYADACGPTGETKEINGEKYDVGTYTGMIKHNVNTVVEALK